jgi:hypothetical protein
MDDGRCCGKSPIRAAARRRKGALPRPRQFITITIDRLVRHPGGVWQLTSDSRVDHREEDLLSSRFRLMVHESREKNKTCENLCIHSYNIWTDTIE